MYLKRPAHTGLRSVLPDTKTIGKSDSLMCLSCLQLLIVFVILFVVVFLLVSGKESQDEVQ